jgi:hypothetical protein
MYKIFIAEVVVYIIGLTLCISSIFSTEWYDLSSDIYKSYNITGKTVDLFRVCTKFVNGTNKCLLYSCSNTSETKDFCEDIIACRLGMLISSIAFLIMSILYLVRCAVILNIPGRQEGKCIRLSVTLLAVVAFIGTTISVGYGAQAMPDLLKVLPPGLITYTNGTGYIMVIVAFICAFLCLILQCVSCLNQLTENNHPVYQYLPEPSEQQYINPIFQDINTQPPPIYSSKA